MGSSQIKLFLNFKFNYFEKLKVNLKCFSRSLIKFQNCDDAEKLPGSLSSIHTSISGSGWSIKDRTRGIIFMRESHSYQNRQVYQAVPLRTCSTNAGRNKLNNFSSTQDSTYNPNNMDEEIQNLSISDTTSDLLSKSRLVDPKLMQKWKKLQEGLRTEIVTCDTDSWQLKDDLCGLKFVAGLDISYPKDAHEQNDCEAYAAVTIFSFPEMKLVHQQIQLVHLDAPYVPGFLAFREFPPLSKLLETVILENPKLKPDVILVDGNGLLHPQKCGIACHIGLHMQIPTIGVAKNLYLMDGMDCTKKMVQDMISVGDYTYIRDKNNHILAMALKTTKKAKNPVYVSIGHKISLETAKKTVLACCKHRVPEPVRFADMISRELIRKNETADDKTLKSGDEKDDI